VVPFCNLCSILIVHKAQLHSLGLCFYKVFRSSETKKVIIKETIHYNPTLQQSQSYNYYFPPSNSTFYPSNTIGHNDHNYPRISHRRPQRRVPNVNNAPTYHRIEENRFVDERTQPQRNHEDEAHPHSILIEDVAEVAVPTEPNTPNEVEEIESDALESLSTVSEDEEEKKQHSEVLKEEDDDDEEEELEDTSTRLKQRKRKSSSDSKQTPKKAKQHKDTSTETSKQRSSEINDNENNNKKGKKRKHFDVPSPSAPPIDAFDCVICLSEKKEYMVQPCNHVVFCASCAKTKLQNCPLCMQTIKGLTRVYF
jgi:hypothetical protein